jgi:hypothetical protein
VELLLLLVLLWLLPAFFIGWIAGQKGRSRIFYFLLTVFLSPLVGLLVLIALPSRLPPPQAASIARNRRVRPCPRCAEEILLEAAKCKHCGSELAPLPAPGVAKSLFWGPVTPKR